MTLGCPSCGARLKAHAAAMKPGTSARCPRCRERITMEGHLTASRNDSVLVRCDSCGARLRAPEARLGETCRCPRCRAEVRIGPLDPVARPEAARVAADERDETTGVATRRIDSKSLGFGPPGGVAAGSGEIDLGEFIKAFESTPPAQPEAGPGPTLMKPPVQKLVGAAQGIRTAVQELGAPPSKQPVPESRSSRPRPEPPHQTTGLPAFAPVRSFPASRGFLAGGLAGAVVGGLSFAVASGLVPMVPAGLATAVPDFLPPSSVSVIALAIGLPAFLGALAGFIAAAAGSPGRGNSPLSTARCAGAALLVGLAAGLLSALASGEALGAPMVWPTLNWMRDLLLVGLLTPALNRILPGSRR